MTKIAFKIKSKAEPVNMEACMDNHGKVFTDGKYVLVCVRLTDGRFEWICFQGYDDPDVWIGDGGPIGEPDFYEVALELVVTPKAEGENK